ncbi:helix-turn-helix transcriptional regulator [Vagococcus coleopterorum]|uniref:Helix-turn-helix transcriptional regulator n=1 Tax=Vagococcus coleopterorum TaxID=2714946 RepID=A0A6G8ANH7_9ENTE|nr:helix-turn-helix domain-containing protein [Vagococcus coleopterorum]QIL46634.1 helix-turn-helix transcriptional regulator [Vagococcus coleopterorum]
MKIEPNYCEVGSALDIIVGKWKPLILLTLIEKDEPVRFNQLHKSIPEISQKVLTKQLRELESENIIMRQVFPEVPPRVEYSMTSYGLTLFPILDAMHKWGEKHQQLKLKDEKPHNNIM